ncbi:PhzF family phenazine biosynthesis protein [Gilvimarinus sp. SDUM040013]|uniref:PhzF family phenazine biosynthesis protein n=1 Tax=Gilvimarinus gilvus TaxID=3058038 RepID=A0ABU4RZK5_9GAMM|nr:PhzF family phenazine biosynthesis protein [Gilvimarinus sp. SDUM040013]MDO3388095.1 PhzF family phenazine biosynthesis protein [Gilvimarinus sp. SDUM040013]MDX6850330.1 PhzF family phenazine biosynthesis protein [Gilvimarinus sp. SDUM040013]
MKLPMYVVNAFTEGAFSGNPAAVVLCQPGMQEAQMQAIASQNNLAETAFVTLAESPMRLRWFTPTVEVDLCGHATLATAVALTDAGFMQGYQEFITASGLISVSQEQDLWQLNFPARPATAVTINCQRVARALGCDESDIVATATAKLLVVELSSRAAVRSLQPDLKRLSELNDIGLLVTAAGDQEDFVARFFAPNMGIDEDPVTGSAYTTLAPYWRSRLDKTSFKARQLSVRGGYIECVCERERVKIAGKCQVFSKGEIYL